jgi:ABC-2 type transport system permease protein
VWALVRQEWYLTAHSLEIVSDLFILNVTGLLVFGFFGVFIRETGSDMAAQVIVLGFLLWELFHVSQYTVSLTSMWNIWSRNLTNILITPISLPEYLAAQWLAGIVKALVVFALVSTVANVAFGFSVFALPFGTLLGAGLLLIASGWLLGLVILGFIFAYGTRYQAVTWTFIFLLQPLTAAFYPVEVLPAWLQLIAWWLPPTYAFEAARAGLATGVEQGSLIVTGVAIGLGWSIIGLATFLALYRRARVNGRLAKIE